MVGKADHGVKEARRPHVVDVGPVAQGEIESFILHAALAEAARQLGHRDLAGGEHVYRLEDLGVTGTAAQVGTEAPGRVSPCQFASLLVEECLRPHQDAGGAKTTLERSGHGKSSCQPLPLGRVEAFQRCDLFAGGLFQ